MTTGIVDARRVTVDSARGGKPRGRFRYRWIVTPRYDLVFFIGSAAVTWVFLGLYHGLNALGWAPRVESLLLTYFLFTAFFDHPHIFQTFSRTHADRAEFARHRRTHTWGLALFILAGLAVVGAGWQGHLIVFSAMFGSYHIMRQHWGILRAYKHLNRDRARLDDHLDFATFYVGAAALYLYDYTGNPPETVVYGNLTASFPNVPEVVGQVTWYAFLVLLTVFAARQVWLIKTGRRANLPKLLLMGTALTTHGMVFFFTATPFLIAEALETAYHDVQYQGWSMHFQRRRFAAKAVVRRWLFMGLVYGLIVGAVEILGYVDPRFSLLFVPFAMIVIWHYWVDGKIWRMATQPELRAAILESADPPSEAEPARLQPTARA